MEMPLVSIIVPVYNAQSHLSRCLESICGQEYKNLELIVINDGSKIRACPSARSSANRTAASCWWTRQTPACPTPGTSA